MSDVDLTAGRGVCGESRRGRARCAGSVEMDCHVVPLRRDSSQ